MYTTNAIESVTKKGSFPSEDAVRKALYLRITELYKYNYQILLKGRDIMSEGLDKLASAIGDTLKTAPTLYEDALQPTVQEVGKFVARIPRAINAAFSGLDQWILNKEYAIDETKKLLEKKLENVDPDKIVEPESYVAVPAIQAISYSMNSEELRNLYANLFAKAMNSDTKDSVHPSFVEIIKQLSPTDAIIFKTIFESKYTPLIDLSIETCTSVHDYYTYNISWITLYNYQEVRMSLDNLLRLGLIEIPFNITYGDDTIYELVRKTDSYIQITDKLQSINHHRLNENKKYLKCTEFSILFYKICIKD